MKQIRESDHSKRKIKTQSKYPHPKKNNKNYKNKTKQNKTNKETKKQRKKETNKQTNNQVNKQTNKHKYVLILEYNFGMFTASVA